MQDSFTFAADALLSSAGIVDVSDRRPHEKLPSAVRQKFRYHRRPFLTLRHRRCHRLAGDFLHVVVRREGPTPGDDVKDLQPVKTHHPSHDLWRLLNAFSGRDLWTVMSPKAIV